MSANTEEWTVDTLKIHVEKVLSQMLGKAWSPYCSINSLVGELEAKLTADPVPPADGEVEVVVYACGPENQRLYVQPDNAFFDWYAQGAVPLVDRAHVTRLQATCESQKHYIGSLRAELTESYSIEVQQPHDSLVPPAGVQPLIHVNAAVLAMLRGETVSRPGGITFSLSEPVGGWTVPLYEQRAVDRLQSQLKLAALQLDLHQGLSEQRRAGRDELQSKLSEAQELLVDARNLVRSMAVLSPAGEFAQFKTKVDKALLHLPSPVVKRVEGCADAAWLLYDSNLYGQHGVLVMDVATIFSKATSYAGYKRPVVFCKRCAGFGTVATGIDESPTTICDPCNGTGKVQP